MQFFQQFTLHLCTFLFLDHATSTSLVLHQLICFIFSRIPLIHDMTLLETLISVVGGSDNDLQFKLFHAWPPPILMCLHPELLLVKKATTTQPVN